MNQSSHGNSRMKQRGIPPLIVQWLDDFGEEVYDKHGAVVKFFNKKSIRNLERYFGSSALRRLNEWMKAYAVFSSDGYLITVGFRTKKINH